jgi:hypothetical protein
MPLAVLVLLYRVTLLMTLTALPMGSLFFPVSFIPAKNFCRRNHGFKKRGVCKDQAREELSSSSNTIQNNMFSDIIQSDWFSVGRKPGELLMPYPLSVTLFRVLHVI